MNSEFEEDREQAGTAAPEETGQNPGSMDEADVLRSELLAMQEKLEVLRQASDDFQDKYLRSRAELDNYRRRSAADAERARAAGVDAAVGTVLRVFDDLERALQVTGEGVEDAIRDGIRLVLDNLEADLGRLGIERRGAAGEPFDPELHEAVTAIPVAEGKEAGTIAQVVRVGFSQGDRLIRPAAVVVYND